MRDIKFRAWDGHQMHRVGQLNWSFRNGITVIQAGNRPWNGNKKWEQIENPTLMQYTGLIDMNGVDVYESDILKITNPFTKRSVIKTVWWNGETARFNGIPTSLTNVYEVIGNIHENLELLNPSNTEAKD